MSRLHVERHGCARRHDFCCTAEAHSEHTPTPFKPVHGSGPMRLYSAALSLFSRKVEIALYEKGLAFEQVMVPFSQARGYSPKHPDVLAANPKGQVPVLVDKGLTLYDSTVILEYLEDAYPAPPLYPSTPEERARCRLFDLFADEIMLVPVRALMHRTGPRDRKSTRLNSSH